MIRNIWCVGRNYIEHIKELHNVIEKEPLIFLKAGSCFVAPDEPITLPYFSHDVHHEIELALQFDEQLKLTKATAALDLTARDIQNRSKTKDLPWTLAKSFKQSCPVGHFSKISSSKEAEAFSFSLSINGEVKQRGNASHMIFSCSVLEKYILENFPVCPGDLLLTGTPHGIGPIQSGDLLQACLNEKEVGRWRVQ